MTDDMEETTSKTTTEPVLCDCGASLEHCDCEDASGWPEGWQPGDDGPERTDAYRQAEHGEEHHDGQPWPMCPTCGGCRSCRAFGIKRRASCISDPTCRDPYGMACTRCGQHGGEPREPASITLAQDMHQMEGCENSGTWSLTDVNGQDWSGRYYRRAGDYFVYCDPHGRLFQRIPSEVVNQRGGDDLGQWPAIARVIARRAERNLAGELTTSS